MALPQAFAALSDVFLDFQDMLDPVSFRVRPLNPTTPRTGSGAPNYVVPPGILIEPAYILPQPKRVVHPDTGDEVQASGTVYCSLDILIDRTSLLVLPDGNHVIIRSDQYKDEKGNLGVQVVYYQ